MGQELHFDFTESADRKRIFGTLVQGLSGEQRHRVASVVDDMSIPEDKHLHDIFAVEMAIDTTVASDWAKQEAKAVYRILADAEAQAHGCRVEETHFHEVGQGMTVREILGICTAVELLSPTKITATAVQVGSGTVECSHGVLDIPAPATAAVLERYSIPLVDMRPEGELCTPTSAALIAHFVEEFA